MPSRQLGKTKLEICAKLGIDTETLDAFIDYINNENKSKLEKYNSKKKGDEEMEQSEMKQSEVLKILTDVWEEYGIHANLTRSERNQVDMWLEEWLEDVIKKEVK